MRLTIALGTLAGSNSVKTSVENIAEKLYCPRCGREVTDSDDESCKVRFRYYPSDGKNRIEVDIPVDRGIPLLTTIVECSCGYVGPGPTSERRL